MTVKPAVDSGRFSKGATWNESEVYRDAVSLRRGRRLTTRGEFNVTPSYHTDTCFTADARALVFGSQRDGRFAVCKTDVVTGDITVLTEPIPAARSEEHTSELQSLRH